MATARSLNNWLEGYLQYTENQESPETLHLWTGLGILSAAVRRQLYVDRGMYKVYPNLFIINVAESGKIRKSAAVNLGVDLLKKAIPDLPYLSDSMTPEAIVANVNRTILEEKPDDKLHPKFKYESHIFIHADELATLFTHDKIRASRLSILLTQMYNARDEYQHITKGEGKIVIYNNYTTLLAATDPFNLRVLPEDAVGGFLGRCIFVIGKRRRKAVAWPSFPESQLEENLIVDLARIGSLKGTMHIPENTRDYFTQWYESSSELEFSDRRVMAFHSRMHDTAWKIATLLSISTDNSLIISENHLKAAIRIVENQRSEFSILSDWEQTSIFAANRQKFLDLLRRNGGLLNKKQILKDLKISMDEFYSLETTLIEEGTIKKVVVDPRKAHDYVLRLSADEMAR